MILLNTVYGLIMAACYMLAAYIYSGNWEWKIALILWAIWTIGHCIYDTVAHLLVQHFNKNKVYRG